MITDSRGCQVKPKLNSKVSLLPIIFNPFPALTSSLIHLLGRFLKESLLRGDQWAISDLYFIGDEHKDLFAKLK